MATTKPLNVLLNTIPLESEHAVRGIGTYTRLLYQSLNEQKYLTVYRSSQIEDIKSIKPDIIHYPFFDLFFSTLPFNQAIPTIVTIHDVIPLIYPKHYKPGIKGFLRFKKQQLSLSKVKAVITDSETSKQDIQKYLKVPAKKIHVVPLAANPALTKPSPTQVKQVRKKYKLPKQYILYVGDINYNKNIPQLIKTLKYLPDSVHLVCVGKNFKEQDIPEWQWIETQLALSNVEKRVHFLTEVLVDSSVELSALYHASLCYLQPSLYEGFGLPVLEAFQAQTPVVSSNTPALLEVGGKHAHYAKPTAEYFAEQVKIIMEWPEAKRQRHLKAALAWATTFTWNKTAVHTLEVYKQVAQ